MPCKGLPDSLIVPGKLQVNVSRSSQYRKQCQSEKGFVLVFGASARPLSHVKRRCLWDHWDSQKALSYIRDLIPKTRSHAHIGREIEWSIRIARVVIRHDLQQGRHTRPKRAGICRLLKLRKIKVCSTHQPRDIHDVGEPDIEVPVHALQCCESNAFFWRRNLKLETTELRGDTALQEALRKLRLLSGLSETIDMNLNQRFESRDPKIPFTGELIAPTLRFDGRVQRLR